MSVSNVNALDSDARDDCCKWVVWKSLLQNTNSGESDEIELHSY